MTPDADARLAALEERVRGLEDRQEIARLIAGYGPLVDGGHAAATAEELRTVYAELGEQIGYEIKEQDNSRPWLIAGTLLLLLAAGASLVVTQRIP